MTELDDQIRRVVASDTCSGCGACAQLDPAIRMELDSDGHLRPRRAGESTLAAGADRDAAETFRQICPGRRLAAARPTGARVHPTMGPWFEAWRAWAVDPAIRYAGSSGGTLTALSAWLIETGEAARAVGARASADDPRRTVSLTLTTRDEALTSAGSRYAPTASAAVDGALDGNTVVAAKPCEISALRGLARGAESPILLGFFCAGTPSQKATDALVDRLGIPVDEPLSSLRYRGNGWPGRFTATDVAGHAVSTDYATSWGEALGPAVQWRCKICPDGIGEHADVVAADLWHPDERGYPVFDDGDGTSALIARTRRGADLVHRAVAAGVLSVEPLDLDELAGVQPLQNSRRTTLLARLIGASLAGGRVPRYSGFGLLQHALTDLRASVRAGRGSYRRRRARR